MAPARSPLSRLHGGPGLRPPDCARAGARSPSRRARGGRSPSRSDGRIGEGWWQAVQRPAAVRSRGAGGDLEPERARRRGAVAPGKGAGPGGARRLLSDRHAPAPRSPAPRGPAVLSAGSGATAGGGGSRPAPITRSPSISPGRRTSGAAYAAAWRRAGTSAQASEADLAAARLSAQAELAQDYFLLRIQDAQKQLLDATVASFQKALELTRNRYAQRGGRQGRRAPGRDAAQDHPGAGDRPRRAAGPARTRHRASDRQARLRVLAAAAPLAAVFPQIPAGPAVAASRAQARHRRGRAAHGGRQRADRRRQGGLLPERQLSAPRPGCRRRASPTGSPGPAVSGPSGRRSRRPSSTAGCAARRPSRRGPPTTRRSPPIARPC